MPKKVYMRGILLHYFIQKKSAAEAHRILDETYNDHALSETTCRDWFRRCNYNDFDVEDKELLGALKSFEDEEFEALLPKYSRQVQNELGESLGVDHIGVLKRLKALEMFQKQDTGCRMRYSRKTLNGVLSRVNSSFNSRKEKIFYIVW